jgi:hypothetical protein
MRDAKFNIEDEEKWALNCINKKFKSCFMEGVKMWAFHSRAGQTGLARQAPLLHRRSDNYYQ